MIVNWHEIERQRVEERLKAGMAKEGQRYLERELKRELRKTERARLRGVWTPTTGTIRNKPEAL